METPMYILHLLYYVMIYIISIISLIIFCQYLSFITINVVLYLVYIYILSLYYLYIISIPSIYYIYLHQFYILYYKLSMTLYHHDPYLVDIYIYTIRSFISVRWPCHREVAVGARPCVRLQRSAGGRCIPGWYDGYTITYIHRFDNMLI